MCVCVTEQKKGVFAPKVTLVALLMSVCADVLQLPPETLGPGPCPAVWLDSVNGVPDVLQVWF